MNRYASGGTVRQLKSQSKGSADIRNKQALINKQQGLIINDSDVILDPGIKREKIQLTQQNFRELKAATRDTTTGKYKPGGITAYQKTIWPDIFENIARKKAGKKWQRTANTGLFGGSSSPIDL